MARRTSAQIYFDGTDITESIIPYLLSTTYTDNEADEADDLQIKLQDRDSLWLESWINEAVRSAAALKLKIRVVLTQENQRSDGKDMTMDSGEFELDSVTASGPPAIVTIKATALPFSEPIRQTKKSRAWESYNLSGIAREIASASGMKCMYEVKNDPFYERAEQSKKSDIDFLSELCKDAGISLKATDNTVVLFDQTMYEALPPVMTITHGSGSYTKYKLNSGAAGTQYSSCRVSYTDSGSGTCIEGTAYAFDYDDEDDSDTGQRLEITTKVSSAAEAKEIAEKRLRLHNKYTRSASFTFPGNPELAAGVTVMLSGWGGWDGKYFVDSAKHSLGSLGYTTQISLRRVLEGY